MKKENKNLESQFHRILQKYSILFTPKFIFFVLIFLTLLITAVYVQYPQLLSGRAANKSSSNCGNIGQGCCYNGDQGTCNGNDLKCYQNTCYLLDYICGQLNSPCCKENFMWPCFGNSLVCDQNLNDQNPWETGTCLACGEKWQTCCYNQEAKDYLDCHYESTCISDDLATNNRRCSDEQVTIKAAKSVVNVYEPVEIEVSTNQIGSSFYYEVDCLDDGTVNYSVELTTPLKYKCSLFPYEGYWPISAWVATRQYPDAPLDKFTVSRISIQVISNQYTPTPSKNPTVTRKPTKTPTRKPTKTPTPISACVNLGGACVPASYVCDDKRILCSNCCKTNEKCAPDTAVCRKPSATPTKKPTKTPTRKPTKAPTQGPQPTNPPQPTINYTCDDNPNQWCSDSGCSYWGVGSCPQYASYCCKNAPPTATNVPVPTKVPNGGNCSSNSQCQSYNCCLSTGKCKAPGEYCPE